MTPERAHEIVSAINDRCFMQMGLVEKVATLKDVTLLDMLQAAGVVREANASAPLIDGKRSISIVPDDRLIAAAYCLEHYPVSKDAIVVVPMTRGERFWHETDLKALAIVPISKSADDDDEDGE